MQFREKGKKILCIRNEYDAEKGRAFGKTVASLDRYLPIIDEDSRAKLTPDEVKELESFLDKRKAKEEANSTERVLKHIAWQIARATESLSNENAVEQLNEQWSDKVFQELSEFRKALRKAGFKAPHKPKKAQPQNERQEALDL